MLNLGLIWWQKVHSVIVNWKIPKNTIYGWKSFQGFLPLLSSHHILFQVPAVVSEKVYIPPALVALFHIADVLVKALILLFTQIFTVLWKKSKFNCRKCSLNDIHAVSWQKLFSSSSIFFYSAFQWFPWKLPDFSDCQVDSSTLVSTSSNMNSLIWGSSNISALSFFMFIHGNFSCRKANLIPSLSIAFTKFFITPNFTPN